MYGAEDWQQISDPIKRRKLQNRINQRVSRQRKAGGGDNDGGLVIKQWSIKAIARSRSPTKDTSLIEDSYQTSYDELAPTVLFAGSASCAGTGEDVVGPSQITECTPDWHEKRIQAVKNSWRQVADDGHLLTCEVGRPSDDYCGSLKLPGDRLLTLIYYNVLRGLAWNIRILGLDHAQMAVEEYPSPFIPLSPTATSAVTKLPLSLRPTHLQMMVEHHPFVDILPCPAIRDNMIQRENMVEDEDEFCEDILGLTGTAMGSEQYLDDTNCSSDEGNRTGVTLWGDPWEIANWEVSEHLATKWAWLFVGAYVLEAATNARRRHRGWKELRFA